MGAMLVVHDRGFRQFGNLMTTRSVTRNLLSIGELAPAPRTVIGVMVNDLLHPVLGYQPATSARVTRLAARLTLILPGLARQLLRFLPRLRATLLTRLRSIRRRRRGTGTRTRGRFLLQRPQPLLGPQLPIHQPHQKLDARLPPRVIDRLRLRPLHTNKVRRPANGTLLWKARRTERLRLRV
jgi:hypothetical protein